MGHGLQLGAHACAHDSLEGGLWGMGHGVQLGAQACAHDSLEGGLVESLKLRLPVLSATRRPSRTVP